MSASTDFLPIVKEYCRGLDNNCRCLSFNHCYYFFQGHYKNYQIEADLMALHLFAFLASWGMISNSSIMTKDYRFHIPVVKIIAETLILRDNVLTTEDILKLRDEISGYYKKQGYLIFNKKDNKYESYSIKRVSYTLVSKILLGTTGLVPAYDSMFIKTAKDIGISTLFSSKSLKQLACFIEENRTSISDSKAFIKEKYHFDYPDMKIVDMYFWQKGMLIGGEV